MKRTTNPVLALCAWVAVTITTLQVSCGTQAEEEKTPPATVQKELSSSELIARGNYITTVSGCNDCHSPKNFNPQGFTFDSTRLLSGHPASEPLPPVDIKALQPGNWMLFSPALTAAVGPWGITYAANLTPDSATGIGAWDEAIFIKALRTGKHMGLDNGRPILPPMPWQSVALMTDEDLKSIYAFLRSLKPVSNRVPNPAPPNEAGAMSK